jgi:hypothetical protein
MGGSWKKLAAAHRWMSHRALPAQCKGCSHEGPMVKKGWQKCPECNNGIRNRGLREQLHLGSKKAFNNTVRETLRQEVLKQVVGISIRSQKVSEHCGGICPLWNEKRRQSTALRIDDDGGTPGPPHRLIREPLEISGLNEGVVRAVESNQCENEGMGKKGEADHRCHKHSSWKRRMVVCL